MARFAPYRRVSRLMTNLLPAISLALAAVKALKGNAAGCAVRNQKFINARTWLSKQGIQIRRIFKFLDCVLSKPIYKQFIKWRGLRQ
jgi:hypothetical protein